MPNWCNNKLAVYGPVEDVKRFREQAIGYSPWTHIKEQLVNALNFHSLVPVPPEVLSAAADRAGYDWEVATWGCKWGACHAQLADEWEGHLEYTFDTAWAPPIPFLAVIAPKWPTLTFLLEYEETGFGYKGMAKVKGDVIEDHCLQL